MRPTRSLGAKAIRTTIFSFPALMSFWWKAAKLGSYRRAISATRKRIDRTPAERLAPDMSLSDPGAAVVGEAARGQPAWQSPCWNRCRDLRQLSREVVPTVRFLRRLLVRNASSRRAQSGSSSISEAISPSRVRVWRLSTPMTSVDAGHHLGVHRAAAPLLLHDNLVSDLAQPRHQRIQVLLAPPAARRALRSLAIAKRAMMRASSRSASSPETPWPRRKAARSYGQAARDPGFPQQQEGGSLVPAGRLHHHQLHTVAAAEDREFGDPGCVIVETREGSKRFTNGVQPAFGHIYSTDNLCLLLCLV